MSLSLPLTLWALGLVGALAAPPVLLAALLWGLWRRTRRDLARAARTFDLQLEARFGAAHHASGRVAGHPIRVSHLGRIEIDVTGTVPSGFAIIPRWSGLSLTGREGNVKTGDPLFDERYAVEGDPVLALALLTPPLRQAIDAIEPDRSTPDELVPARLLHPVRVEAGRLTVHGGGFPDLSAAVRFAADMAQALRAPEDLATRLAENLRGCRCVWEKLAILRALGDGAQGQPAARQALLHALTDSNEEVRLAAALGLGDEGVATLAAVVERAGADETRSAQALRALGPRADTESLLNLLSIALRVRRHVVAAAAIESLATRNAESITGRLTAVLARGVEDLSLVAARALATRGDGAAEPALVSALESEWSSVRLAAAEALGVVGGTTAVAPLRAAADSGEAALRGAARRAVAAIQSRLPGADWGQVSLPEADGGGVALADQAPRGRVSLAERH